MDTPFNTATQPIQYSTPAANALNGATAPSTPVKKQTTQSPDGTVNTVEYHPPAQTNASATNPTTPGLLSNNQSATYNPYTGTTAATPITGTNQQTQTGSNDQTVQPTQSSGTNTTYPGLISSLANNSVAGSPVAATAAQGLLNNANTNPLTSGASEQNYQQSVNDLNTLQHQYAQFNQGFGSEGTPFAVRQGEQAAAQQAYNDQLAAGEQRVTQAQQGLQYGLTEQSQQQTALNDAGSIGNTAQGYLQTGLTSAASAAAPTLGQPGQAYYNPQTGGAIGGTGAAPAGIDPTTWATYANDLATGQTSGIPGSITGNAELYGQLQQAAKGINPNINLNTLAGQASGQQAVGAAGGQAQASNIQTAGTAATSTAAQGYSSAAQTYTQFQGNNTAATQQAQQVQSVLSSTGLNSGVPDYNKAINSLSGRLGSTQVAQLTTSLTELQNMYSQILSVGGTTPSGSEQQALSVLNPNSSAAQINASIQQLQEAAYNRGTGLYSQLQTYSQNLGAGGSTATSGGSSGSVSYDF